MLSYEFVKTNQVKYPLLILMKNSDSPFSHLKNKEINLKSKSFSGNVIIDEMLHSGNNDKRFILARFKDGKFLNASFRYLSLDKQNKLRNYMCNFLRKEIVLLRKSLLLERQRNSILSGENI